MTFIWKITKWSILSALLLAVFFLGFRVFLLERGPDLEPWHTLSLPEPRADEIDKMSWDDYLKTEEKLFTIIREKITQHLTEDERIPINRYFEQSPVYPGHFKQDWNRSYVMEPDGTPTGATVFLHGLTDSPYSLRHIARRYRDHGFLSLAIRLPGHGTIPSGLSDVHWQDWVAATRLAVREARRRIGPDKPIHIVGFSNGGALALKYTLNSLEDASLPRPERLVLISPMVGITAFARFAGLAGLPALLPRFAKAAWLSILPEFNPFKYNSFPVNGARQSYQLTNVLQESLLRHSQTPEWANLPPILTFQSVLDFTVSTRAIITSLYALLPPNGSELVLFDLNRSSKFGSLLRTTSENTLARILPPNVRDFKTTVITNADENTGRMIERSAEAGQTTEVTRPLDLFYPADIFSLSHVAIPFPSSDGLYGSNPDPDENYGVNLGALAARGEQGTLIVGLDALLRMSSNPFYPYLIKKVESHFNESK